MNINPDAKYVLIVEGDWNDCDIVDMRNVVSGEKLSELLPLLKRLKKVRPNWVGHGTDACALHDISGDEYKILEQILPWGESYNPIHTITEISVEPFVEPLWTWEGRK